MRRARSRLSDVIELGLPRGHALVGHPLGLTVDLGREHRVGALTRGGEARAVDEVSSSNRFGPRVYRLK